MNKLRLSCAAATLFALTAPSAHATLVFTFDPNANRVVNGNLATYTLSITGTTPGEHFAGFHGNFPGNNAFSGPLLQQLASGVVPTPTMDLNSAIDESLDSQFLVTNSQILSAVAPFESSTTLGGAFTLALAARAQTKALVQIVAHVDDVIAYDFSLSFIGDGISPRFQGVLGVPEPSSLALAATGLLAALAIRRQTRNGFVQKIAKLLQ
jgi:hypothetical protein